MLAVIGALIANALITVGKFAAAVMTGSSGMMAEAFHSLADTTNQIFLLLGLRFFNRPPSSAIISGTARSGFSGRSSRLSLFSASVQPMPYTKASKNCRTRTRLKISVGHIGYSGYRSCWKRFRYASRFIRKRRKQSTKDCRFASI